MSGGVLLDTHVLIWIVEGLSLRSAATTVIDEAALKGQLYVSAASAWEVGYLASRPALSKMLSKNAKDWFWNAVRRTRAQIKDLEADPLLEVGQLPMPLHRDPADRMLIATARHHDLTLVTRDRPILDYAALGHVRAIAC